MFAYFYETSRRLPLGWNLNRTAVSTLNLAGVPSFIISEISPGFYPLTACRSFHYGADIIFS